MAGSIILVGGGLGGSLLSIFLGRAGHTVHGFDLRGDPRKGPVPGGRSINLALSARGLHALERAGLAEEILSIAIPMRGRMIHARDGKTVLQPYGTEPEHVNQSVSRAELNVALLNAAERLPDVRFTFGTKYEDHDPESGEATFYDVTDGARRTVRGDVIIGADGAFSAVRRRIQRQDRFDYRQSYLSHGYKELTIPALPGGRHALDRNSLHIWPRGGFMMIALPNRDGSFTCTLFWPFEGPNSFAALRDGAEVRRFFEAHFPDAVSLMPDLAAEYAVNPVGSLVTIRCSPWRDGGRVVLIGDACHAVVPFHGQGANAAFEDCVVLDECLAELAPDWEKVFARFEARRRENTDALADLSIANFVEMRDHTASRSFQVKKTLEKTLHRLFPDWYIPLYMMISYTRIPYAEAVRRDRRQKRALRAAAGAGLLLLALIPFLIL